MNSWKKNLHICRQVKVPWDIPTSPNIAPMSRFEHGRKEPAHRGAFRVCEWQMLLRTVKCEPHRFILSQADAWREEYVSKYISIAPKRISFIYYKQLFIALFSLSMKTAVVTPWCMVKMYSQSPDFFFQKLSSKLISNTSASITHDWNKLDFNRNLSHLFFCVSS